MLVVVVAAATAVTNAGGELPTAAAAAARGGTLTVANPGYPPSLDPATGINAFNDWVDLAYDCLFVQQPNGQFASDLATSWSYGRANRTFTITLRSGVRFSDGTRLTAVDFKDWIQHAIKLPGGEGALYFNTLKSISILAPLKLRLNFATPTPNMEYVLSNVLELGCPGSLRAIAAGTLQTRTDGAGPYMLDASQTVAGSSYVYVPNPHYWNKSEIHWHRVVIKVMVDPAATLEAMQSGQVQLATQQPVSSIGTARSQRLKTAASPQNFYGLDFLDRGGTMAPALASLAVRQAINYAINRPLVCKAVFGPYAHPTDETALPGNDSYLPALEKTYPYDPQKAKSLLAGAGYGGGITLQVVTSSALSFDTLTQALGGELAQVGITLQLVDTSNEGTYLGNLASAKYPVATIGFGGLPAYFDYQLLWGPSGIFNPFHTASPELTKLSNKLRSASSPAAQRIAQQMQTYVTRQAWFAPVCTNPLVAIYKSSITGVNTTSERPIWYMPEIAPAG